MDGRNGQTDGWMRVAGDTRRSNDACICIGCVVGSIREPKPPCLLPFCGPSPSAPATSSSVPGLQRMSLFFPLPPPPSSRRGRPTLYDDETRSHPSGSQLRVHFLLAAHPLFLPPFLPACPLARCRREDRLSCLHLIKMIAH